MDSFFVFCAMILCMSISSPLSSSFRTLSMITSVVSLRFSAAALSTGQWYHIVGVCKANGSPIELWVNGVKVASSVANFSGTLYQPLSYVVFGNDGPTGTYGTAGYMDDLYIFEQALSYDDILNLLYNSGTGATYPFN